MAGSLAEALSAIRAGGVDVVLLDLGLTDSRRMETFSRMRAAAGDTPIVILTVLNDDEVAHEAMKAGAQDYLVKDQVGWVLLKRSITYAIERAANQKALHDMSARLLQLQDEERRRLARELHDGTAQDLAALSMNLSVLRRRMEALSEQKPFFTSDVSDLLLGAYASPRNVQESLRERGEVLTERER